MEDRQTRNYEAGITGKTIMENFGTEWAAKPPIVAKKGLLDASLLKIEKLQDKQEADNTGNATAKRNAKVKAANNAWTHCKVLAAFATDTNDDTLRSEIDFEITDLLNIKDSKAKERWNAVFQKATDNLVALTAGGYDIDAASILTLKNDIKAFTDIETAPRSKKNVSKAATTDMKLEFKNLKKIKVGLIELLATFKTSNSEFYLSMVSAFSSVGVGVRHLAMRVTYIDEDTNVRLKNVKSQIVELTLGKLSSERGIVDYSQLEMKEGNYTMTSGAVNYEPNTINNIAIEKGKILKMEVKMKKIDGSSAGGGVPIV